MLRLIDSGNFETSTPCGKNRRAPRFDLSTIKGEPG
jgi:hypothetical protein